MKMELVFSCASCRSREMAIVLQVCPLLCSRLKYLNIYWMVHHEILLHAAQRIKSDNFRS